MNAITKEMNKIHKIYFIQMTLPSLGRINLFIDDKINIFKGNLRQNSGQKNVLVKVHSFFGYNDLA